MTFKSEDTMARGYLRKLESILDPGRATPEGTVLFAIAERIEAMVAAVDDLTKAVHELNSTVEKK